MQRMQTNLSNSHPQTDKQMRHFTKLVCWLWIKCVPYQVLRQAAVNFFTIAWWSRQFGIFNSKTDKRQPPPSVTTHFVQRPFRIDCDSLFSLSKASLHCLRSDVASLAMPRCISSVIINNVDCLAAGYKLKLRFGTNCTMFYDWLMVWSWFELHSRRLEIMQDRGRERP